MKTENLIVDLSFQFALDVIEFCEELEIRRRYVVARQLIRSGTSIVANVRESQSAESKSDFIHKLKVAAKEAEETEYWLLLCKHSKSYQDPGVLLDKIASIQRVMGKIISSSKTG